MYEFGNMTALSKVTASYNENASKFINLYESCAFLDVHAGVADLLPNQFGFVLDIGAGSGRDAAWFASKGHEVVAVEPATKLLDFAKQHHQSAKIRWVNDALPDLSKVMSTGLTFDLIWLSAIWMHIAPADRELF